MTKRRIPNTEYLKNAGFTQHFLKSVGFTLAEALVAMVIFTFIITVTVTTYISGLRIYKEKSLERDLIFETQNTLKDMTDNIRKTASVQESVVIGENLYSSDSNNLILKIPAIDVNGDTIYQDGEVIYFDYIIYEFDNPSETIKRNIFPNVNSNRQQSENVVIMKEVDELEFTYFPQDPPSNWDNISSIKAEIEAHKTRGNITKQIELSSRAKPRNN